MSARKTTEPSWTSSSPPWNLPEFMISSHFSWFVVILFGGVWSSAVRDDFDYLFDTVGVDEVWVVVVLVAHGVYAGVGVERFSGFVLF